MARHLVATALQSAFGDVQYQCGLPADELGEIPLGVAPIDIVVLFKALAQVGYRIGFAGDKAHSLGRVPEYPAPAAGAGVARVTEKQVAQART